MVDGPLNLNFFWQGKWTVLWLWFVFARVKNFAFGFSFTWTQNYLIVGHRSLWYMKWDQKNNLIRKFLDQYQSDEYLICNKYAIIYYCSFVLLWSFFVPFYCVQCWSTVSNWMRWKECQRKTEMFWRIRICGIMWWFLHWQQLGTEHTNCRCRFAIY